MLDGEGTVGGITATPLMGGVLTEVTLTGVTAEGADDGFDDIAAAHILGTGWVGNVIDVVRGDVEGMDIFGGAFFGSSKTCFVVLISLGGIGWVGSWTTDSDGEEGAAETLVCC